MKSLITLLALIITTNSFAGTCWQQGVRQTKETALFKLNKDYRTFSLMNINNLELDERDLPLNSDYDESNVLINTCLTNHKVKNCTLALEFIHPDYSYYQYDINLVAKLERLKDLKNKAIFLGEMTIELRGDYDNYYYGPEFKKMDIVCKL